MNFPLDEKQNYRYREEREKKHSIKAGSSEVIRRATLITVIGMFLAKLSGFLRELLIVPKFGYGMYSDAYINAFQIPDLVYELLIGGVVAAVLTPTLSSGIENNREKSTWHSVSVFATLSILFTLIALGLAELLASPLMHLVTGASQAEASLELQAMAEMAVPVTRILLLQSFFMILVALLHGSLSAYKRFTALAMGPVFYNVLYIIALLLRGKASQEGIQAVAVGVVFAAFAYFLLQLFASRREICYFHFSLDYQDEGFKKLLHLAIPTLISGSVLQLSSIVMNRFANGLNLPGAVTAIRQCTTTWGLPYAIFTVAIGNVMLPNISGFYELEQSKKVRSLYTGSLRRALFYVAPFALAFAIMNFETIQAIFQWDAASYTNQEVAQTASALKWFSISIVAQTVVFLTNQAFYARKITHIALLVGIFSLVMNPLLLYIFVEVLDKGLAGIGMAHAVYSSMAAFILYFTYKRHRHDMRPYKLLPFVIRLGICLACSGLVMYSFNSLPLYPSHKIGQLLLYAIKLGLGLLSYYFCGISMGFREAVKLQSGLRKTFGLKEVQHETILGN